MKYLFERINLLFICTIILCLGFYSCTTSKQMIYLNDLEGKDNLDSLKSISRLEFESRIQKNDLLWITVGGPNSEDLVALNSGLGFPQGAGVTGAVANQSGQVFGYLVEADGSIKIPYVGKVNAAGLTRKQLEEDLTTLFKDFTKDPVVNVRYMNYRVTVIGEVLRPGTIVLPNERLTILEAIGMSGDLTIMGKRESVLIIREVDGKRTIGRVNLLSSELFNSPFYYLKTNDIVYIEQAPAKFFARERLPQFISLAAGSLSILAIILSLNK